MGQIMIPDVVREYANDDIISALDYVNETDSTLNAEIVSMDFHVNEDGEPDNFTVYVDVVVGWEKDSKGWATRQMQTNITFEYVVDDEDVYTGGDVSEWGDDILTKIRNNEDTKVAKWDKHNVSSSTSSRKQRITAAEDDGFDDEFGQPTSDDIVEDEPDSLSDTLDGMADQLDDIQDTVDEVDEDEVDIEVDNNIDGHYIAECDRCHGVFISAMIESDQPVDHISGTCPLCEKETDQYLKWVVKKVEG